MKFFIDTANLDEIKTASAWGIIDGVTTNPSLIAKEGGDFKDIVKLITTIVDGPISAEVVSLAWEQMVKEARELAKISDNIVIKLPMTEDGIRCCHVLSQERIRTNLTLIFSPAQALVAAKAGASYVSPFVGRLDDIATDGMNLIEEIVTIFQNYDIATEIIVASVRHPIHVIESAKIGADIATIPFKVLKQLFGHPLTTDGINKFLEDWKKSGKQI